MNKYSVSMEIHLHFLKAIDNRNSDNKRVQSFHLTPLFICVDYRYQTKGIGISRGVEFSNPQ